MLQTNPNKINGFGMWPQFSETPNYHIHIGATKIESESCYTFDTRTGLIETFPFIQSVKDQGIDANISGRKCV